MSKREKRDGAMRIFEALSGVDERYLEACEQDGTVDAGEPLGGGAGQKTKVVPFAGLAHFNRKYGKLVAAALVLCVVGVGYWGMNSFRMGSDNTMNSMVPLSEMAVMQAPAAEEAMPEEGLNSGASPEGGAALKNEAALADTTAVGNASKAAVPEAAADESMIDGNMNGQSNSGEEASGRRADDSGSNGSGAAGNSYSGTGSGITGDTEDRAGNDVNREQAVAPDLYAYVPKVWPEGCVTEQHMIEKGEFTEDPYWITLEGADADSGGEHAEEHTEEHTYKVTVRYLEVKGSYPDRDETFVLRIMQMPGADRAGKAYTEGEFDAACVEKEMAGGEGNFGVIYQAGSYYVLVRFMGSGSAQEIWEMMASIQP